MFSELPSEPPRGFDVDPTPARESIPPGGSEETLALHQLRAHKPGVVRTVEDAFAGDVIANRLRELGFVRGERVEVVARGPFGGDPLLVQVGHTRFALRRAEAARIRVVAL